MTNTTAKELLGGKELIFALDEGPVSGFNAARFREFVELAVDCGATHIEVGTLPYVSSWFLPDNTDPYAAWCNQAMALFRVCPPDELQEWIPHDSAAMLRARIDQRLEIIRPYGLKGVADRGIEPIWLPEGVYRAHPRWRGAQCELGRIARRPYFAPAIDEPDVLKLYRKAACAFAQFFPDIDELQFMTNDSGGGLPWAPNLYPGMNGPARWRTRDPGKRISEWLGAIQQGAAAGGTEMRVNLFSAGLPPAWVASTRARLGKGLFINFASERDGETWGAAAANLQSGVWTPSYPVLGMADPETFIRGLQSVYRGGAATPTTGRASIGLDIPNLPMARRALARFFANPGTGSVNRAQIVVATAVATCADKAPAEQLIDAWTAVKDAVQTVAQVRQKGFGLVLPWCGVSMRWLVRPLVPKPAELSDSETAHFRDVMFSANPDRERQSFSYVLGKGVFNGESVIWMTRWCLHDAIGRLEGARNSLIGIAAKLEDATAVVELRLYADRVGALICAAKNARHTVMYQYALDIAGQPQFGPNCMDYDDNIIYDQRALVLRKIAREELDNMVELVEILESQSEAVIAHAAVPEDEGVFMLGSDIIAQLKRKITIMLDHWQNYEELYPATKVWDLEPEMRGNIVASAPPE